jgi:hypothetical protein
MHLNDEPVMVRDAAVQCVHQIGARRLQPAACEIGEAVGIGFAGDQQPAGPLVR